MASILGSFHCNPNLFLSGDTPPSLSHSDSSYEETQFSYSSSVLDSCLLGHEIYGLRDAIIMAKDNREDINAVIDDVIVKINRISDHLRYSNENEAANDLNRDMTGAFRKLFEVIAPWSTEKCQMRPTTKALSNGANAAVAPAHSWAAVAATASPIQQNCVVKYPQAQAVKQPVAESDSAEDQRVVWVAPWQKHRPHTDITKAIEGLGALFSIAYSSEAHGMCIIFQHASTAYQFLQFDAEHVASTGHSRFGMDVGVQLGALYPSNNDIKRMDNPTNERRRLTFARQQLFSNGLTEDVFRRDIESLVGNVYVELLWLFNTGNATVVFSAVPLARLVRDTFRRYAQDPRSHYYGIMVSYSHDPCERPLHLVTQMPGHPASIGNGSANMGGNGENRYNRSCTFSNNASNTSGRQPLAPVGPRQNKVNGCVGKADKDGWQVVHGKKR